MNTNLSLDLLGDYLAGKKKADDVLALPRISKKDLENLTRVETDYLYEQISQMYYSLEGEERDMFTRKIQPLLSGRSNKEAWEHNHSQVNSAIEKLVGETGAMPSHSALARETGLSRQTIIKHLKEYGSQPALQCEVEQLKNMAPTVLSKIYELARIGDRKAARLYFEIIGSLSPRAAPGL